MSAEGVVERFERIGESRLSVALQSRAAAQISADNVAEQLVSLKAPTSMAADQYRSLRHNVESLRKGQSPYVIAITSPTPSDGKTVTTLNLAGAFAQEEDARVLVIDADLRHPSVESYLGFTDHLVPGLADALCDSRYELGHIVRRLKDVPLWFVAAGKPSLTPYELLNSTRFEALLQSARRDFSCVLIDTPPCVIMPDCRQIDRLVDGFLLVIAAHKTPRALVAEALNELNRTKTLGIVFNADNCANSKYYGYYGDAYHPSSRRRAWWNGPAGGR